MIKARITAPPDKSISHRALILSSIAEGKSEIDNCSTAEDVRATLFALKTLGISIKKSGRNHFIISGKGIEGLINHGNKIKIQAHNSGTTARFFLGLLAGAGVKAVITGDKSLSERPMKRIADPLKRMGAEFQGNDKLPMEIKKGIDKCNFEYKIPVNSAQVKSALLLAGLFSKRKMIISESISTRNHTEILLKEMGASIFVKKNGCLSSVFLSGASKLKPIELRVPGDFSSAAYFIALGIIAEKSDITIDRVGLNPTRTKFLDVLGDMGAKVSVNNFINKFEPYGTVRAKSSKPVAVNLKYDDVSLMIDEIPIFTVISIFAKGNTVISGAEELRYKESDRIKSLTKELGKLGIDIRERKDGLEVKGLLWDENKVDRNTVIKKNIKSEEFKNLDDHGDHRIAMALAILEMALTEKISKKYDSVNVSYPDFYGDLAAIYLQGKLNKPVILAGFMGAGKTTTGRLLAKKLGLKFYDTDKEVEKLTGKTIVEIFKNHGEKYFRRKESEVLRKLLAENACIISTGGGTLLNEENLKSASKVGKIFVLEPEFKILKSRLMRENKRPSIKRADLGEKEKTIEKIYNERKYMYKNIKGKRIVTKTSEESCRKILWELFTFL